MELRFFVKENASLDHSSMWYLEVILPASFLFNIFVCLGWESIETLKTAGGSCALPQVFSVRERYHLTEKKALVPCTGWEIYKNYLSRHILICSTWRYLTVKCIIIKLWLMTTHPSLLFSLGHSCREIPKRHVQSLLLVSKHKGFANMKIDRHKNVLMPDSEFLLYYSYHVWNRRNVYVWDMWVTTFFCALNSSQSPGNMYSLRKLTKSLSPKLTLCISFTANIIKSSGLLALRGESSLKNCVVISWQWSLHLPQRFVSCPHAGSLHRVLTTRSKSRRHDPNTLLDPFLIFHPVQRLQRSILERLYVHCHDTHARLLPHPSFPCRSEWKSKIRFHNSTKWPQETRKDD